MSACECVYSCVCVAGLSFASQPCPLLHLVNGPPAQHLGPPPCPHSAMRPPLPTCQPPCGPVFAPRPGQAGGSDAPYYGGLTDAAPVSSSCVLCHQLDFEKDSFGDRTVIICDQCEREFHVGCLRQFCVCDLKVGA